MDPTPVRVDAHPPERRRPKSVTLPCGSCCCCCCCLHTLGGLIGAAVCSTIAAKHEAKRSTYFYDYYPDDSPEFAAPRQPNVMSAATLYWLVFLGLTGLSVFVSCLGFGGGLWGGGGIDNVAGILLGLAIFLPGVQLVASLIAIPVAGLTDRPNAAARIWTVGKITLGFLAGTGIGLAIMFLVCVGAGWMR